MTGLLVLLLLGLGSAAAVGLGWWLAQGIGVCFAACLAWIFCLWLYQTSNTFVLNWFRARRAEPRETPAPLAELIRAEAAKLRAPEPEIWLIDSDLPNLMALGSNDDQPKLVCTTALTRRLRRGELQALIAQQMVSLRDGDPIYLAVAARLAWLVFWPIADSRLAGALVHLVTPWKRVTEADEAAAALTHHPMRLACAIRKIEDALTSGDERLPGGWAMAHLWAVNPLAHPQAIQRVRHLRDLACQH